MLTSINSAIKNYGMKNIRLIFPNDIWWLKNIADFSKFEKVYCTVKIAEEYPNDLMVCPAKSKIAHIYSYDELNRLLDENIIQLGSI